MNATDRQRAARANKLCGHCHNDYVFYVAKLRGARVPGLCADCGQAFGMKPLGDHYTTVGALMSAAGDAARAREVVDTAHAQGQPLGGFGAIPAMFPSAPPIGAPKEPRYCKWDEQERVPDGAQVHYYDAEAGTP